MPEEYGLGCLPSPVDPRDYHVSRLALAPRPTLPVAVPLPPGHPWDQGSLGTCVGHGTGMAVVIAIHKATGKWIVKDALKGERLAKDLYLQATGDTTYMRGAWVRQAVAAAKKIGVLGADGKRYKIQAYHSLLPAADIRAEVETALAAGMGVITAWEWPRNWMAADYPFDTLPNPRPPTVGGHCVLVWRAAMKHPAPNSGLLRRDHAIENSWDGAFTKDGSAYLNSALENTPRLWEAWVVEA